MPERDNAAAVIVPVKAFDAAKSRLGTALDAAARAALARAMADSVLAAAGTMPVTVACDDDGVAAWAIAAGASVVWTHGMDLNASIAAGVAAVVDDGCDRVVVSHADLPFATNLERVTWFGGATIVPDRRDDGTNVLCIPASAAKEFTPAYGPASFPRHLAQLRDVGLDVRVARLADLRWDVDEPADVPVEGSR